MFIPHAETVCRLIDLEHQERMRHAANQRTAASVQAGAHSPLTISRAAARIVILRLGGWRPRLLGPTNVRVSSSQAGS